MDAARSRERDPYPSTSWTVVRGLSSAVRDAEFQRRWRLLVEDYRRPITATLRRTAQNAALPLDELTDGFFTYLFETGALAKADPAIGRFRAFVQGIARNYVHSALRERRARLVDAEDEVLALAADARLLAEEERAWSSALLAEALDALATRHPEQATAVRACYGIDADDDAQPRPATVAEVAHTLGVTPNAVSLRRLRGIRFLRQYLQRSVAKSVAGPAEYADEFAIVESGIDALHPGLLDSAAS